MSQSRIRCFFLEPTDQVEMALRRFYGFRKPEAKCAGKYGYHNADVVIGRGPALECPEVRDGHPVHGDHWPHNDSRWPKACACGYVFTDDDEWQFNPHTLFKRSDDGALVTLQAAPAGAMWDAHWMGESHKGPDGIHLVVKTPGGEWAADGPAYSEGKVTHERGWTRTGTAPDFTANPSIHIPGKYHGFLRGGWLEEC